MLVLRHDFLAVLEFVQKLVGALLQTDHVRIRLQNHFYYCLVTYLCVVAFEPHIIGHYAQVGELFYHWEILKFSREVFEVHVIYVELVSELRVGRGLHKRLHSFLIFFFRYRYEPSIVEDTAFH